MDRRAFLKLAAVLAALAAGRGAVYRQYLPVVARGGPTRTAVSTATATTTRTATPSAMRTATHTATPTATVTPTPTSTPNATQIFETWRLGISGWSEIGLTTKAG